MSDTDIRAQAQLQAMIKHRDLATAMLEAAEAVQLRVARKIALLLLPASEQSTPARITEARLAAAQVEHRHALEDLARMLLAATRAQCHVDFVLNALQRSTETRR